MLKIPSMFISRGRNWNSKGTNNTTYPSPFIMSDDPQHIYLCWRGINWHPTIARLTLPDADGDCHFDFGPRQLVQSTGARPYAKYQSNGRDKIYVSYTTGHPDNEMPDWLYLNVVDINHGNGPILRDLNGRQLSVVDESAFRVNKSEAYAADYPATIVDRTADVRNSGYGASPLRLTWMQGDYYYWMVRRGYPKGYPTAIRCDHDWQEKVRDLTTTASKRVRLKKNTTLQATFEMDASHYEGVLLRSADGKLSYSLNGSTQCPELTIDGTTYASTNRLLTSDDWATASNGTNGDHRPTKLSEWTLTLTYDGRRLTVYRNGLVDQVVEVKGLKTDDLLVSGQQFSHRCQAVAAYSAVATPLEVQQLAAQSGI